MDDWSQDAVYAAIDTTNITYIDMKGLDGFFKRNRTKGVQLEDNAAIIRRLDLNNDSRLNKEEFLKGIAPQEPFSKMLIRQQMKHDLAFGKME